MSAFVRPDLDALEALLNAGTPGPWRAGYPSARCHLDHGQSRGGHGTSDCHYTFDGWLGENYSVSRARDWQPNDVVDGAADDLVAGAWGYEEGGVRRSEDVALIVASVNAAPGLIAYARELEARNEQADALLVDARRLILGLQERAKGAEAQLMNVWHQAITAAELLDQLTDYQIDHNHLCPLYAKDGGSTECECGLSATLGDAYTLVDAIRALPDREEPDA